MSPPDRLLDATRRIVERVAGPSRSPAHSGPATPLAEAGFWLDSVELLEVIVACEAEFGITFGASRDLSGEALGTLGSLAALIRSKHPDVPSSP